MKIHIVSGFLGAGKTTFINKVLPLLEGQVCIIENEFGDMSVDGQLMPNHIETKEIYAGCICCSLVGDFRQAIWDLYESHKPDHLIIEPSGVGALSEVIKICQLVEGQASDFIELASVYTLVDALAFEDYIEGFGAFYRDQIENASMIFLSFAKDLDQEHRERLYQKLKKLNKYSLIVTEDWKTMTARVFESYLCLCPPYDQGSILSEACLPADDLLTSYSIQRPKQWTLEAFEQTFKEIGTRDYGQIIRAKGVLKLRDSRYIHFDYTPFHQEWSYTEPKSRVGVAFIGTHLKQGALFNDFSKKIVIKATKGGCIHDLNRL